MLKGTLKDIITNVLALVMAVISAVQIYIGTLGDQAINWYTLTITVVGAIVAWLTGKDSYGKAKVDV